MPFAQERGSITKQGKWSIRRPRVPGEAIAVKRLRRSGIVGARLAGTRKGVRRDCAESHQRILPPRAFCGALLRAKRKNRALTRTHAGLMRWRRFSAAWKAALAMSGSGAPVAALAIGPSTRPIPLEAKRPNFARSPRKALPLSVFCLIGNPRVWAATTRLVAPRSCWARTACRGATWPRLDRLRVGRVMGHFQRLQIPLTPQIFVGRAVFGQNARFHMVYAQSRCGNTPPFTARISATTDDGRDHAAAVRASRVTTSIRAKLTPGMPFGNELTHRGGAAPSLELHQKIDRSYQLKHGPLS